MTAATLALYMIPSIGAIAGILFVICRCLQMMGIASIKGHPVEFNWPLVAAVWYLKVLVNIFRMGRKKRQSQSRVNPGRA